MDPLLIVAGIMMGLGSIYWWQQQMVALAGADGMNASFACLVTGGYAKCPEYVHDYLLNDNLTASAIFYIGLGLLIYSLFFARKPQVSQNHL